MVAAQFVRLPGERGTGFIDLGKQPVRGLGGGSVLPQRRLDKGEGVPDRFGSFPFMSGNVRGQGLEQLVQGEAQGVVCPPRLSL
jgi:hypothetical protein